MLAATEICCTAGGARLLQARAGSAAVATRGTAGARGSAMTSLKAGRRRVAACVAAAAMPIFRMTDRDSRKDADIQSTRSTEGNTGSVSDNKKRKALQFVNRPNGELCWEGRDISQEFGRTERMKRKTNGVRARAVVSPSLSGNTYIHTYIHTYITECIVAAIRRAV